MDMKEKLNTSVVSMAGTIHEAMNGPGGQSPLPLGFPVGFILLAFNADGGPGRCSIASNGSDLRSVIRVLREQADLLEEEFAAPLTETKQ